MQKTALSLLSSSGRLLPYILSLAFLLILAILQIRTVSSATADHLVISEIQVAGESASDDFIELYNPSASSVDLSGWRIRLTSTDGLSSSNLVASMSGTIPGHGFFLLANNDSPATSSADLQYLANIPPNNTLSLYSDAGITLVDLVGMGTATASESASAILPGTGLSIERKANSNSTINSMFNGIDMLMGNGEDTDNNSNDFLLRDAPQPQNSEDDLEPEPAPTPSASPDASPSASPDVSPSPDASPSPSVEPSAEPSEEPSPTPSEEPSPQPSPSAQASPSVEPSPEPSPSAQPSPSVEPSAEPSPSAEVSPSPSAETSPSPSVSPIPSPSTGPSFPFFTLSCQRTFVLLDFRFFVMRMPRISCTVIRH